LTPLYIAQCSLGKGVFTAMPIHQGELILEFSGTLICNHPACDLEPNHLQVGSSEYLSLNAPGVFANHSCDPNSGIVCDTRLIALRDIRASEQICFDYSTTMDEDCWTMECRCGESTCRGIIRDFRFLPEELREKYLRLGIAQRFIATQWVGNKKAILANR
jgi:uncharacterized protein